MLDIIMYEPVDGEEEVVDADGGQVPGRSDITPTRRSHLPVSMDCKFCQVQDQSWSVRHKEDHDYDYKDGGKVICLHAGT